MAELHDTLINATNNETSKDKLYEMYNHFLTDKTDVVQTPKSTDYLSVQINGVATPVSDTFGKVLSPSFTNGKKVSYQGGRPVYT